MQQFDGMNADLEVGGVELLLLLLLLLVAVWLSSEHQLVGWKKNQEEEAASPSHLQLKTMKRSVGHLDS